MSSSCISDNTELLSEFQKTRVIHFLENELTNYMASGKFSGDLPRRIAAIFVSIDPANELFRRYLARASRSLGQESWAKYMLNSADRAVLKQ